MIGLILFALPGGAITLVTNGSFRAIQTDATAGGTVDSDLLISPTPFGPWNVSISSSAVGNQGTAIAIASASQQHSSADPSLLTASGSAGVLLVGTSSSGSGSSTTAFSFDAAGCERFNLSNFLGGGSDAISGTATFQFLQVDRSSLDADVILESQLSGAGPTNLVLTGQLSTGSYVVQATSSQLPQVGAGTRAAPSYDFNVSFSGCLVALITQQPQSASFAPGSTASLTVGASGGAAAAAAAGPAASFSYQWRHDGQDLVNGARISGATSATLMIQNFGAIDEGSYSVWVNDGSNQQLSSRAVLSRAPAVPGLGPLGLTLVGGSLVWTAILSIRRTFPLRLP